MPNEVCTGVSTGARNTIASTFASFSLGSIAPPDCLIAALLPP
jgi:hypothetical protein